MRGTPSSSSGENVITINTHNAETPRPPIIERRPTQFPAFVPQQPVTGRVYGGGSGSDGVFANLSAKPERGEKVEEHPPVSLDIPFSFVDKQRLTTIIDIRTSCRRCSPSILGDHNTRTRTWRNG